MNTRSIRRTSAYSRGERPEQHKPAMCSLHCKSWTMIGRHGASSKAKWANNRRSHLKFSVHSFHIQTGGGKAMVNALATEEGTNVRTDL